MPTGIDLKGFKEFQKKLENLPHELEEEIDAEVADAGKLWEQRAKQDAPVDQGLLRSQIRFDKTKNLESQITSPVDYSAYIEWGTKSRASVPAEIASYAEQFRGGKGNGGEAKKMIFAWMDRVGIPKEAQYPIFISIITKGIKPHPYFFIQQPIVEKELIGHIQSILKTPH